MTNEEAKEIMLQCISTKQSFATIEDAENYLEKYIEALHMAADALEQKCEDGTYEDAKALIQKEITRHALFKASIENKRPNLNMDNYDGFELTLQIKDKFRGDYLKAINALGED